MMPAVLCGIDILMRDNFAPIAGRKVALITNHTGRSFRGEPTVDVMAGSRKFELKAIFSPEHGLRGEVDESVSDSIDPKTGLMVYSLYDLKKTGEDRYRPSAEKLAGCDTVVFDIQDIGARFYTYTGTMGYAMEVADRMELKFVVLDRPNPIGGLQVEGPLSEAKFRGLTAFHSIPVRHGMTAGELALMYKKELKLKLDLQVIWCEGWKRSMHWDETGLTWVNPSPNMRNLNQALLYPGICLLEATNMSVGRGTDQPFEQFGAPWLDGPKLAQFLNQLNLPGVRFYPITFTPTSSKFSKEKCSGVFTVITDRNKLDSVRVGMEIVRLTAQMHKEWEKDKVVRLLHNQPALDAILSGSFSDSSKIWQKDLANFKRRRQQVLHYD